MIQIIGTNNIIKNRYIRFELTGRCNYSCKYCSYKNTFNKSYDSSIWKQFAEFVNLYNKESKYKNQVMLWGGEPTLHPNFFEICDNLQIPFGFYTNLSKNVDFFLDLYKFKNFVEIYISIHIDQDKNIDNTLDKINEIQKNNKSNVLIRLAVMLEENHINECIEIFKFLDKKYENTVIKAVDTHEKYYSIDVTRFNNLMKNHQYILYNNQKYTRFDIIQNNLKIKECKGFLCNCPSKVIHIDSLGNIYNCLVFDKNNIPISNIFEYEFKRIDNGNTICRSDSCYNYLLKTGKRRKIT